MNKKIILLLSLFCVLFLSNTYAQEQRLAYQSFDNSDAENLNYTLNPESYIEANGSDIWAPQTALDGISPSDGSMFWGMRDLENNGTGGAFEHTITTDFIDLSGSTSNHISFEYHVLGYDSGDYLAVTILDGSGAEILNQDVFVSGDVKDSGGWQTFNYNVDDSVDAIRIVLRAKQNGGSDYAGFDNIQVFGVSTGDGGGGGPEPTIGTVTLSTDSHYAYEAGDAVTLTASLNQALNYSASVDLIVATANADAADYSFSSSITIPAGSTSASVELTAVDDTEAEGPETITLSLSNLSDNLVAGSQTSTEVVLYSNDFDSSIEAIEASLTGSDLIEKLRADYSIQTNLNYTDIREEMYKFNGFDNDNGSIEGVYTGYTVEHNGRVGLADKDIHTEHTWPQSFYDSAEPMVSDAHHLFPVYPSVNSSRSNNPFAEVDDATTNKWWLGENSTTTAPTTDLVLYSETGIDEFEPRDEHKGNVARAMFYMYTMYQTNSDFANDSDDNVAFFQKMKDVLRVWNQIDPVDEAEIARSHKIAAVQGNENPFVLDPTLVERAFYQGDFGGVLPFYNIGGDATGETLQDYIADNFQVSNPQGYNGMRDEMYKTNGIDNVDGTVIGVYSGYTATDVSDRSTAFGKDINTEHTWPQGNFDSAEPMRGDGHHLFPSRVAVNSARGNNPFAEIDDQNTQTWFINSTSQSSIPSSDVIDGYAESTSSRFEPRESVKGNVARAIFYMWAIYQDTPEFSNDASFFNGMKNTLYMWHKMDPVDDTEWNRSLAIEQIQGNINPFVQDSSLVRRMFFMEDGGDPGDGGGSGDDETVVFFKDFEDDSITSGGWTVVNEIGDPTWRTKAYGGTTFADITAYQVDGGEVKGWLISPEVDFDAQYDEILNFRTVTGYNSNSIPLRVFVGTGELDFDNLNMEALTELNPTLDDHASNGYGSWTESGDLDLADVSGTGHILFFFHNTDGSTAEWELDDIKLFTTTPTAVEDEVADLPKEVQLLQNYPNPFNPSTTISFDLQQTQHITLDIFDVNGRVVRTLVNGVKAAGMHSINFDAQNLPSGVYIYRLRTPSSVVTSKMTLLK